MAAAVQRTTLRQIGWPIRARHLELSIIASLDDDPGQPSPALIRVALDVIQGAFDVDLSDLADRSPAADRFINVYPGEHYRLLAGAVRQLRAKTVVEIGTYTGLSALAMLHELPRDGRITTFDLWPWERSSEVRPFASLGHEPTALRLEDFADGRLVQELADLSDTEAFTRYQKLLGGADILFVDGPKDGSFEPMFLSMLKAVPRQKPCLLIFDDIRVWGMIRTWRRITSAKLDVTSFGHWTGTGLVWLPPTN